MTSNRKVMGYFSCAVQVFLHLLLSYTVFMLARIVYLAENWGTLSDVFTHNSVARLLEGCWMFDTSAVMYTNCLVVLLAVLLPQKWNKAVSILFTVITSLTLVMNLGDAVYFQYTGRRTTMSVFGEFSNEGNLLNVLGAEAMRHWYLFLLGFAIIYAVWRCSRLIMRLAAAPELPSWTDLLSRFLTLLAFVPFCIAGMRGGWTTAVRPVTVSNAAQYVRHPSEAVLILNTPFSMLRTIGKNVFHDPQYFSDSELDAIWSPVHEPVPGEMLRKNVVVLIVESFGREYIGAYNEHLDGGKYKGYAPFIDSLYRESLSFDYTFANGRQSIDGMPSILSGIPRFIEPFFLTPASMNSVSGLAGELGKKGWYSAFFHGAANGSMGFEAFAKATGYDDYFGRTEFDSDPRFGGESEYDGTWAIWDEPFLQYYALKMSEFREPFITSVFTASSHHPYAVPEKYKEIYKDEDGNPIHKCIRYTDMALRKFFETARRQPWYKNTIFVFTSDHTNIADHQEYRTDLGLFGAPLLFFDPSGGMPRGRMHSIAQQTDILPTVLGWLRYPEQYVAWGVDLLNTPAGETWAVNHTGGGLYQFVKGNYLLQFDGQKLHAVYNFRTDWMLRHNLLSNDGTLALPAAERERVRACERQLKAIIQTYMQRMVNDKLVIR
ncbi:MAG: LTA synthase family protein [Bacteroidales bacterium]|nr:LTA synthase family protein [Bacteroidales bacterium]MCM1146533.1 LTA synthase family protein [Bacteroidales bacterium]MCM1205925.1 LTA synthase family protein [Bacillota bacterium]MCM1510197.1 LTA synthase family protein [Clostridium sp.]